MPLLLPKIDLVPEKPEALNKKKVLVGITGSLDSVVTTYLLQKQGYDCVGLYIELASDRLKQLSDQKEEKRPHEKVARENHVCFNFQQEKIKEFCQMLKIPLYITRSQKEYIALVLDPLVESRLAGEIYNPCVICHQLKLEILVQKANLLGIHHIATGHYAKINKNFKNKSYFITNANDIEWDQSYFLSQVEDLHMERLMLPLGEIRKVDVRKIGETLHQNYKNSRNNTICMVGDPILKSIIASKVHKSFFGQVQVVEYAQKAAIGELASLIDARVGTSIKDMRVGFVPDEELFVHSIDPLHQQVLMTPKKELYIHGVFLMNFRLNSLFKNTTPIEAFYISDPQDDREACKLYFKNNDFVWIEFATQTIRFNKGTYILLYSAKTKGQIIGGGSVAYFVETENVKEKKKAQEKQEKVLGPTKASDKLTF